MKVDPHDRSLILLSCDDLGAFHQGCLVGSVPHGLGATVTFPRLLSCPVAVPLPRLAVGMEGQSFAQAWCTAAMDSSC